MTDVYPTRISDLMKDLQGVLDKHGDIPVTANGHDYRTAFVFLDVAPDYYDGGALIPTTPRDWHCYHWVKSRTVHIGPLCHIKVGEPEPEFSKEGCERDGCPDLYTPPEKRDTIDGEPVGDSPYD